ncbi:MAG: C40 family peptidase [Lachnospiraceae bacterium]|nr:C40 family peptidase [Lachnospiraceae bacterium]
MNRNRKIKIASYTLAASVLVGAISTPVSASPFAGATAALSSNVEATAEVGSYTTLSGINLAMAGMLTTATSKVEVSSSDIEAVAVAFGDTQETPAEAPAQESTETTAQDDFSNIAIAQVDSYINVRSAASEDGEVLGKLYNNGAAKVVGQEGDWLEIESGNVTGYVKSEYVVVDDEDLAESVSTRVATVDADALYVRSDASSDAEVVTMVPNGDGLTVTDESTAEDGWIKVTDENGDEGYVSADYVDITTEYTYAESKEEEEARLAEEEADRKAAEAVAAQEAAAAANGNANTSSQPAEPAPAPAAQTKTYAAPAGADGSSVVAYASQFVGNPYRYGGSSLTNGTDCSGFVMSVYGAFGVNLPHSSSADRSVGVGVGVEDMQPGDIVCYSGHVAIYAGNGQIVHASTPRTGIKYSDVNYRQILAVRRIF